MTNAGQLVSQRVVTGFPEQRLAYVAPEIQRAGAHYCAVLEPHAVRLLGIVRFSNVVARPGSATRIFSDLMEDPPAHQVREDDPADLVQRLFERTGSEEVTVLSKSGEYVGLITRESLSAWHLLSERRRVAELGERLGRTRAAAGFVEDKARRRIAALGARLQEIERNCEALARELNTPLQSLLADAEQMANGQGGAGDQLRRDAARLQRAADGMITQARRNLQDQWRSFARVDLNEVVAEALDFYDGRVAGRRDWISPGPLLPVVEGNYVPLLHAAIDAIGSALHDVAPGRAPSLQIWTEESEDGPVLLVRGQAAERPRPEKGAAHPDSGEPAAFARSAPHASPEEQTISSPGGRTVRYPLGRLTAGFREQGS